LNWIPGRHGAESHATKCDRKARKEHKAGGFYARFAFLAEKRWTMLNEPHWISREECLVLHEMMLLRYGGVAGVRDSAGLDTVVAGPKERFAAGTGELVELATCYAAGIVLNRPFTSGNLASGFLIAATFLGINRLMFRGKELPVVRRILGLAEGHESEAEFAFYLRCNCRPTEANR
jgi:death on curing protein